MLRAIITAAAILSAPAANAGPIDWIKGILGISWQDKMLAECERVLKQRLYAPSTYVRGEVTWGQPEPVTLETYMRWDFSQKRDLDRKLVEDEPDPEQAFQERAEPFKEFIDSGWFSRVTVIIQYDSGNEYGGMEGSLSVCTHSSTEPEEFEEGDDVAVDGLTESDWNLYSFILTGEKLQELQSR